MNWKPCEYVPPWILAFLALSGAGYAAFDFLSGIRSQHEGIILKQQMLMERFEKFEDFMLETHKR